MREPLFSIIIPTYNSEQTLVNCLDSIVYQTFQDFEIMIVDGVSSDNTLRIVNHFANRYSNIRWISEKDKGIYDAMNKGIKLAKGKWLSFLGCDDSLYSTNTLADLQKELKDFDVVYGNVISTHFKGIYDGEFTENKILEKNICHQAVIYKKTVFDRIGDYNTRYKSEADWDHNFRWFFSNKLTHKFIDIIIATYGESGISSNRDDPFFVSIKQWKYNFVRRKQIKFSEKIQIIKSQLKEAFQHKRKRNFFTIISQVPNFLFSK